MVFIPMSCLVFLINQGAIKPGPNQNERTGLYNMLEALKAGSVEGVIVSSYSRIAREITIHLDIVKQFERLKKSFASVSESEL